MTQTLVIAALTAFTCAAAPPTPEDPRMTLVKYYGGRQADQKVIAEMVAQLGDEVFAKRQEAAKRLRALGPQALPALRNAARGKDLETAKVARKIATEFEREMEKLPAILRDLLDGADGSVMADIQRLPHTEVRRLAFYVVSEVRWTDSMRVEVMRAFCDPDNGVGSRAMAAMQATPSPGLDVLLSLANHADGNVRAAAVYTLYKHKDERARVLPALLKAVRDPEAWVRRVAAGLLKDHPGEETIKALTLALKDADDPPESGPPSVAFYAAISLAHNKDQYPRVARIFADVPDTALKSTRAAVLRAYVYMVGVDKPTASMIRADLFRYLRDKDLGLRGHAAWRLSENGENSDEFLAEIRRLLNADGPTSDKRLPQVHASAAKMLGRFGSRASDVVPRIIALLDSKDSARHEEFAEALGLIGVDTPGVRAALGRAASKTATNRLSQAAKKALIRLDEATRK